MLIKSLKTVNIMGVYIKLFQFIVFFIIPFFVRAQPPKLNADNQRLLLELSLNYYTVVKEGRVDQDSSLLMVSRRYHISRWSIFSEGFPAGLKLADNTWIDSLETGGAKARLPSLKGVNHVQLLVLLGAYYAFQPGYRQADRDSAQKYLFKAKQESELQHTAPWLNQTLILLGKNYFKSGNVKEGIACFNTVIKNCQKTHDLLTEAKAWDYQGTYIPPAAPTLMLIIKSIKKASAIYSLTNQRYKRVNALMNIGYISFLVKDSSSVRESATTALHLAKELNFPYLHYTYDLLAIASNMNSQEHKELGYGMDAIKSALATKDSLGLPYFYIRLGHISFGPKETEYPFADFWLRKSFNDFTKNRDQDVYFALLNLTDNLKTRGRFSEAIRLLQTTLKTIPPDNDRVRTLAYLAMASSYAGLGNNRSAEKYYLDADELQSHDTLVTKDFRNAEIKYAIGMFYFHINNYDKAEIYLKASLATPGPKDNEMSMKADVYINLYKIDSLRGNYESAASNLHQYITLKNRYTSVSDAKSITGLRLQVLMTQKEKDLQILQAKSALQLQQAATIRKFIYLGLATALFIIAMLYSRFYINRKQRLEMNKKNAELLKVINEKNELLISKEWLLKEVHHRVKNNLHTVICLLESQADYLENDALKAIENSQHRIYAMSLIHQKLYQSDDIKTVDMLTYLPEFVTYLKDCFETGTRIRFELDIDSLKISAAYAVPLSLIINEAVTNSIKYAFPNGRKGKIAISLKEQHNNVVLTIADNGIGISENRLADKPSSLGLKLLKGLSQDIKADYRIENDNGTVISLAFETDDMMYMISG